MPVNNFCDEAIVFVLIDGYRTVFRARRYVHRTYFDLPHSFTYAAFILGETDFGDERMGIKRNDPS